MINVHLYYFRIHDQRQSGVVTALVPAGVAWAQVGESWSDRTRLEESLRTVSASTAAARRMSSLRVLVRAYSKTAKSSSAAYVIKIFNTTIKLLSPWKDKTKLCNFNKSCDHLNTEEKTYYI